LLKDSLLVVISAKINFTVLYFTFRSSLQDMCSVFRTLHRMALALSSVSYSARLWCSSI